MGRLAVHALAWLGCVCVGAVQAAERVFSVAAGTADQTLLEFCHQAGLRYSIKPEQFHGIVTHAVQGTLSVDAALITLLDHTGIRFTLSPDQAAVEFALVRSPNENTPITRRAQKKHPVPQATADRPDSPRGSDPDRLSNVTVTGTLIHQWAPVGVQLLSFSTAEVQDAGYSTLADFFRALPQSFGSGPTPDTHLGVEAIGNTGMGTGLNLRGLGARATLTLVNGKRLAPSGSAASFTDIANIPLCATKRMELLPDSAATTYGSDAVGGVVNVFTRDGTEAPVSSLQWSSVARGSQHTGSLCQTFPMKWASGNFIVALGGSHQTPLEASDRSFYRADLTYGGGPNLNLLETDPPTLSSLNSDRNWFLPTRLAHPTASDFHSGTPELANRYQDAQIIASQDSLNAYTRLLERIGDDFSLAIEGFVNRRRASQLTGPQPVDIIIAAGSPYYVDLTGDASPEILRTNLLNLLGPEGTVGVITVYNLSIDTQAAIGEAGTLSVTLHRAKEKEAQWTFNPGNLSVVGTALASTSSPIVFNPYDQELDRDPNTLTAIRGYRRYDSLSELNSVSITFDDEIAHLPMGALRGALGGEFRNQLFQGNLVDSNQRPFLGSRYSRHLLAGFAEVTGPLWTSEAVGLKKIVASVSARHDDYSDFGTADTPRAGLEWTLLDGLTFYSSYGYSFRAPDPGNLDSSSNSLISGVLPDTTAPSGQSRVLFLSGNNSALKQEHAIEKTLGMSARVPLTFATVLNLKLNYFSTRLKDGIESTAYSDQLLNNAQYAYIVTRNPSAPQLAAACSTGRYLNSGNSCQTSSPQAIVDLRLRNVSALQTRGVDFDTTLSWDSHYGSFNWRTFGTYLLQYAQVPYPGAPQISRLNTDHNPIRLRFRDAVGWHRDPLDVSISMNFTNRYYDVDSQPPRRIGSWVTFDWQFMSTLPLPSMTGALHLSGGMQNVFNRAPPFLSNQAGNVGYDQENFDPQGRMWFFNLSTYW